MAKHILLVDDDELLRRSLSFSLTQSGYQTSTAASAEEALLSARLNRPDLVLLDIGLPGMDGLEALRHFQNDLHLPVIFLTARRRELDEILGMEMGADDYITKPFNLDVLIGHIKAVLRRTSTSNGLPSAPEPVRAGDLEIEPRSHQATIKGRELELTPREFDMLYLLAVEAGNVVPVGKLLTSVWGAEFTGNPQLVYVHMRLLREKIEKDPSRPVRILTIRGIGYKLAQPAKSLGN